MISKRSLRLATWLTLSTTALIAQAAAAQSVKLDVLTDRPDALYHVGQTVTFNVSLLVDKKPLADGQISYVLSNDGHGVLAQGTLALTGKPLLIQGKLDQPGFLRATVTYVDPKGKKQVALGGAGIDPLDIKPSMPVPDDFDAFWAQQRKRVTDMPMKPTLTPVKTPEKGVECFDLRIDCPGGAPVSGYYARPAGAKPKSLPAILSVHGAGVCSSNLGRATADAKMGAIAADINAHGIPNGKPKAFYQALNDGRLKDYRHHGKQSRDTSYFLGMYLRLMRAMDFLTSQPEWDGRTLIVHGSSQGGGQSLVAAGLDPRVTALAANVPAMCDHTGVINGWPRLVPHGPDGKPDPKTFEASRYVDAMNFAARTRAEALVSVGFIDDTCRPTTVYAAYNNLKGPKRMLNEPRMRHEIWDSWRNAEAAFIKAHIERMRALSR
ncbi:MAG: acetylxylan esterase [Phycisphaerae bacterium]|nr:acetylxylan esterase [Phycisphaerae bacterium]